MNVDDGSLRKLLENEKPRLNEVLVRMPRPDCGRCRGKGSIRLFEGSRPERRRAWKEGLPISANFMPCPECNPNEVK